MRKERLLVDLVMVLPFLVRCTFRISIMDHLLFDLSKAFQDSILDVLHHVLLIDLRISRDQTFQNNIYWYVGVHVYFGLVLVQLSYL